MQGVSKYYSAAEASVQAIKAGNDIIELTPDLGASIAGIKRAIENGELTQAEIDLKCRKILQAKYWVGLNQQKTIELNTIISDLNSYNHELLNEDLHSKSITLLRDSNVPVYLGKNIATLSIGNLEKTVFQETLESYVPMDHYNISATKPSGLNSLVTKLNQYDLVIVGMHQFKRRPNNYNDYAPSVKKLVNDLSLSHKAIFTVFRNPYTLANFKQIHNAPGLLVAYQGNKYSEAEAAHIIFGTKTALGSLPVSIYPYFPSGSGIVPVYSTEEPIDVETELASNNIPILVDDALEVEPVYDPLKNMEERIDQLVQKAISAKATPGAIVHVSHKGKKIFEKSYGHHTYDQSKPVKQNDLYDLASITKVSSSLPALMKLHGEGRFDLDAPLSKYFPEFEGSNKGHLTFREMLAHNAQLKPWIPYWKSTVKKNGKFKWGTFKKDSSARFPTYVAPDLYLHKNYKKKIYKAIEQSPLEAEKKYKYSGLLFYLLPDLIKRLTGESLEVYLYSEIYKPIGAERLRYKPLRYFDKAEIVPTEYDSLFRKTLIHGNVHDEGAAMMDGVSSNAGLFASAEDLAKLMQLYLNEGEWEGNQIIAAESVREFIKCQFCDTGNRRGLGFDKPNIEYVENGNTAKDASPQSFGHSGFTGTFSWVDPEHDLVYVFLSNRVYPTRENRKLYELNTRTDIQQAIYDGILGR